MRSRLVSLAVLAGCAGGSASIPSAPSPSATVSAAPSATSAPTASAPVSASAPDADAPDLAKLCLRKIGDECERRHIRFDSIASVQNVRLRLEIFGHACADSFPEWAAAATRASKTGAAGRRRVFGELLARECPAVATSKSGADVVAACPGFVGSLWSGADGFLARVDAGTLAFATLLRNHGFDGFAEELAMQAALQPQLDP